MSFPTVLFAIPDDAAVFPQLWSKRAQDKTAELGWTLRFAGAGKPDWNTLIRGCDGIITSWPSPRLDGAWLAQADNLRIMAHAAGSVADFISPELFTRGIKVASANPVMAHAVAEWCLTMTLLGTRRVLEHGRIMGQGELDWQLRPHSAMMADKTVGIWGFGDIARRFCGMLAPLTPERIQIVSDFLDEATARRDHLHKVSLEEMLATSDVIVLLEGMTPQNAGRIGHKEFSLIRDDAVFLNPGRAHLTDRDAFYEELAKERFLTVLDVYHREPVPQDDPLLSLRRVILTPHIAGYPATGRFVPAMLDELSRFFSGEPLHYEITAERAAAMTTQSYMKQAK